MGTYANYEKKSLLFDYYIYVDVRSNYSKNIFKEAGIKVFRVKRFESVSSEYTIIYCKVLKRDSTKFAKCMKELLNKMLIMGKRDYESFCEEIMENMGKKFSAKECTGLLNYSYVVKVEIDCNYHFDVIVTSSTSDNAMSEKDVANWIKMVADRKYKYKRMSVNIKNIGTDDTVTFSYINEDVKND